MKYTRLDQLQAEGFDLSAPFGERWNMHSFAVRCSQCEAVVINGIPTHEHGCPNAMHECNGCNNLIPMRQRYCEECS